LQVGLEDRLQHDQGRRLHDAVLDRRDTKRPLFSVRLRDIHTTHRLRLVRLLPEFFRQFFHPLHFAIDLDIVECLSVHARRAIVGEAAPVRGPEHVLAIDLVIERVEAEFGVSLRFGMQRRLQLLNRFENY
jgi:hypothetical protein